MTKHPDLFAALAAPFDPSEVKVFSKQSRQIHYVTARVVMNRLDTVLGPENWFDTYAPAGDNSTECRLTIRLPDGSTLTKSDAGGAAGMADSGDDDKSSYSDAFKRAAVKFGVARYLYGDGVPTFVQERVPAVEVPSPQAQPTAGANGHHGRHGGGGWGTGQADRGAAPSARTDGDPKTGKALFKWCKDREEESQAGVLKYVQSWGKLQDFPGRLVDWNPEQVALGLVEARRKLEQLVEAD